MSGTPLDRETDVDAKLIAIQDRWLPCKNRWTTGCQSALINNTKAMAEAKGWVGKGGVDWECPDCLLTAEYEIRIISLYEAVCRVCKEPLIHPNRGLNIKEEYKVDAAMQAKAFYPNGICSTCENNTLVPLPLFPNGSEWNRFVAVNCYHCKKHFPDNKHHNCRLCEDGWKRHEESNYNPNAKWDEDFVCPSRRET
jgi:hypothetical protein